jgi:hypothetical protein
MRLRKDWKKGRTLPQTQRRPLGAEGIIAVHEAAHAVATLALGYPLHSVTVAVTPGAFARGLVSYAGVARGNPTAAYDSHGSCQQVLTASPADQAVIYLAGGIAEGGAGASWEQTEQTTRADWEMVQALAAAAPDPQRFTDQASMRAGSLLRRHWPGVTALANALVKERTLSGDQAREIINAAMGRG